MPRARRPRIHLLAALLIALSLSAAVPVAAGAAPVPKVTHPKALGTQLANRYLSLLKGEATPALKAFLASGFLIQRADGSYADKATYLKGPVTNIKSFTITAVKATVEGGTLVVRYTATTDQIVEGKEYKKDPAPRLSTFTWSGTRWQLIAHANFNTPVAS